jgi:hypothetical protein
MNDGIRDFEVGWILKKGDSEMESPFFNVDQRISAGSFIRWAP